MILESVIRCPNCGNESAELMPMDACQFFYDCKRCGYPIETQGRRLLRLLLLRDGSVSSGPGVWPLLRIGSSGWTKKTLLRVTSTRDAAN